MEFEIDWENRIFFVYDESVEPGAYAFTFDEIEELLRDYYPGKIITNPLTGKVFPQEIVKKMIQFNNFSRLPPEMVDKIGTHLDYESLVNLASTSTQLRNDLDYVLQKRIEEKKENRYNIYLFIFARSRPGSGTSTIQMFALPEKVYDKLTSAYSEQLVSEDKEITSRNIMRYFFQDFNKVLNWLDPYLGERARINFNRTQQILLDNHITNLNGQWKIKKTYVISAFNELYRYEENSKHYSIHI